MPSTYTVQKGDTKKKLEQLYGIPLDYSGYRSTDPNLLYAGETINPPTEKPLMTYAKDLPLVNMEQALSPFGINIGSIPEATYEKEPITVTNYKDVGNERIFSYSDGTETREQLPSFTPSPTVPQEETFEGKIVGLQSEISQLEQQIARSETERTEEYEKVGLFDDIRRLNELKDTLSIELQTKEELRGKRATKAEYAQTVQPKLEAAYIESSALANIVTVNKAQIDQMIDSKKEADLFLLENKNKRLDFILKQYSGIITEQQKMEVERLKHQNNLDLKQADLYNGLISKVANNALDAGVDLMAVFSAVRTWDLSEIYKLTGAKTTTGEMDKTISEINRLEDMLTNKKGLMASSGRTTGVFEPGALFTHDARTKFRLDAKNIVNEDVISYFLKLKAGGATFGAMSEAEWRIISDAATTNFLGIDRETGISVLSEKEFEDRLVKYQTILKKATVNDYYEKAGMNVSELRNGSDELISSEYKRITEQYKGQYQQDFNGYFQQTQGQANIGVYDIANKKVFDVISREEGFKEKAYQDQAGVWTIGYGTTKINGTPVKKGDTISREEAVKQMMGQSKSYQTFSNYLGDLLLSPNQVAALTSFEYNLGSGIWNGAKAKSILENIKNGNTYEAALAMLDFNKVRDPKTGKLEINNGLIARRIREANLLLS